MCRTRRFQFDLTLPFPKESHLHYATHLKIGELDNEEAITYKRRFEAYMQQKKQLNRSPEKTQKVKNHFSEYYQKNKDEILTVQKIRYQLIKGDLKARRDLKKSVKVIVEDSE